MDAENVTDAQIIELDISDIPMDHLASIDFLTRVRMNSHWAQRLDDISKSSKSY